MAGRSAPTGHFAPGGTVAGPADDGMTGAAREVIGNGVKGRVIGAGRGGRGKEAGEERFPGYTFDHWGVFAGRPPR